MNRNIQIRFLEKNIQELRRLQEQQEEQLVALYLESSEREEKTYINTYEKKGELAAVKQYQQRNNCSLSVAGKAIQGILELHFGNKVILLGDYRE